MNFEPLRIALISADASPLAEAGGDAGGENVYAAHVARCLAAAGHQVDVLTRRDAPGQGAVEHLHRGARVLHIDAGPARFVPGERLLPHMGSFADAAQRLFARSAPYDVIHADSFMSGLVGLALRRRFGVPLVTTFHALSLVRREPRGADPFPSERIAIERRLAQESDRVVASGPQDEADLVRLYGAPIERIARVPCDLLELERNPERAASMGHAGVRHGRAHITWEQVALRLARVYAAAGEEARGALARQIPLWQRLSPSMAPSPSKKVLSR